MHDPSSHSRWTTTDTAGWKSRPGGPGQPRWTWRASPSKNTWRGEISDRAEWLKEKRRLAEERMDLFSRPLTTWGGGEIDPTHRRRSRIPGDVSTRGLVLDAACGTGKYWLLILEGGFRLAGVDQSKNMLLKANGKFPGIPLEKTALQDLAYTNVYDGIICMDAMEYVPPEDWPIVLSNFHRALRAGGHLYFTVEMAERQSYASLHSSEGAKVACSRRRMGL